MPIQSPSRISHPPSAPADERRAENRRRLREFLRATPRSEPESRLELLGPDKRVPVLVVTRAQLTDAIEQMRPRVRQIIRLTLEERRTREEVCEYLHGISERTLERDQAAGLDRLAELGKPPKA